MVAPSGLTSIEIQVPSSVSSDSVRAGSSGRSRSSLDSESASSCAPRAMEAQTATTANDVARMGVILDGASTTLPTAGSGMVPWDWQ